MSSNTARRWALIGTLLVFGPALAVVVLNYYMRLVHPELLARGTTATITAREESGDRLRLRYQVDDPSAAAVIQRLNRTTDLTHEVPLSSGTREWQQLKVGERFCIVYTEVGIQNMAPGCKAAQTPAR